MSFREFLLAATLLIAVSAGAAEEPVAPLAAPAIATDQSVSGLYHVAPQFTLGAPQPLALGVEVWRPDITRFRAFLNAGYLPYPFTGGTPSFNIFTFQAGARWFPWEKGFFGSLALGYRHLGASTNMSAFQIEGETLATNANIDLYTFFTGVSLGAEFALSSKLTFAFDLGAQIPILGKGRMLLKDDNTGTDSATSELLALESSLAMSRLAKLLLPQVTLFRLTWNLD